MLGAEYTVNLPTLPVLLLVALGGLAVVGCIVALLVAWLGKRKGGPPREGP